MSVRTWLPAILGLALLAGGCERKRDKDAKRPLHEVVRAGRMDQIPSLIARGASVHSRDERGRTPLHVAAAAGHTETVQLLIACGAWIDSPDDSGQTAATLAMQYDRRETVKLLVEQGAALTLHMAAYLRDIAKAESLLEAGSNINAQDQWGRTPLHLAAQNGHLGMVQVLVARKADVNRRDGEGNTPLWRVMHRKGPVAIAEHLLLHGADPDAEPRYRGTPLSYAAEYGLINLVRLLISHSAGVDKADSFPLQHAADRGHTDVVRSLLAAGADVNRAGDYGWTALLAAASGGNEEIVEMLLAAGANVAVEGGEWEDSISSTALHLAAWWANRKTIELLLAKGADVNVRNRDGATPLHHLLRGHSTGASVLELASDLGVSLGGTDKDLLMETMERQHEAPRSEILDMLLARGADVHAVDRSGVSPFAMAAARGYKPAVEALLAEGADINGIHHDPNALPGVSPLLLALRNGYVNIAGFLIDRGADVNAQDRTGRTPLLYALGEGRVIADLPSHVSRFQPGPPFYSDLPDDRRDAFCDALRNGYREVVKLLLARGAHTDPRDEEGYTPLHRAVRTHDEEIARLVISCGAELDAKDRSGATPLHYAARGHTEFVVMLLTHGAAASVVDVRGNTPLHMAALRGHQDIVVLLLAHGADPSVRNNRGHTPQDEAARRGHLEIAALLATAIQTVDRRGSEEDNGRYRT